MIWLCTHHCFNICAIVGVCEEELGSLFSLIVLHSNVSDEFGKGINVSLVKDKSANLNNVSKYA